MITKEDFMGYIATYNQAMDGLWRFIETIANECKEYDNGKLNEVFADYIDDLRCLCLEFINSGIELNDGYEYYISELSYLCLRDKQTNEEFVPGDDNDTFMDQFYDGE